MNSEISQLIDTYAGAKSFSRVCPSKDQIAACEKELNVSLPPQYIEFLEELGQGGFNGVYVLGFSRSGSSLFAQETEEHRAYGLPQRLVVVENCDEWLYCLDCIDGSVCTWAFDSGDASAYPCFDDYFLDRLKDAVENL